MKKTLSILLVLILLFSALPMTVNAQSVGEGLDSPVREATDSDATIPQRGEADLAPTGATVSNVSMHVNAPVAGQPASYFADPLSSSVNYYVNQYNGGNFKNGVEWYDVSNNTVISKTNTSFRFVAGKQYRVTIDVRTTSGNSFASSVTANVNNKLATAEAWDSSSASYERKVIYTFTCKSATTVSSVAVGGIVEPVSGQAPYYSNWSASGTGYKRCTLTKGNYRFGIQWRDATDYTTLDPFDTTYRFKSGHRYEASVIVMADTTNGYVFGNSLALTMNGVTATGDAYSSTEKNVMLYIRRTFTCVEPIGTVTVTDAAEPFPGESPVYTATVSGNITIDTSWNSGGYQSGVAWLNEDGTALNGKFEDGKTYRYRVAVKAKSGYGFTSGTKATVNGYTATVGTWTNVTADKRWIEKTFYCMREQISSVWCWIDIPEDGEKPSYYASIHPNDYDSYQGKVIDWRRRTSDGSYAQMSTADTFEAGGSYYVDVAFTPASDRYEFSTSSLTAEISNMSATIVSLTKQKVVARKIFTIKEKTVVDSVKVTITAPRGGNTPSYSASVPSAALYEVNDVSGTNGGNFLHGVSWYNLTDKKNMTPSSSETFEEGKKYTFSVYLLIKDQNNYAFTEASLMNGTVNGKTAQIDDYIRGTMISVSYTFVCKKTVNNLAITLSEPAVGSKPPYDAAAASGSGYKIENLTSGSYKNGVLWYCVTDERAMNYNDCFEAGKTYRARISIVVTDENEYEFAHNNQKATLNGEQVGFQPYNDHTGAELYKVNVYKDYTLYNKIDSVAITVTPPAAGELPDPTASISCDFSDKVKVGSVEWSLHDRELTEDEVFEAGEKYYVRVHIYAKDNSVRFDNHTSLLFNGTVYGWINGGSPADVGFSSILACTSFICTSSGEEYDLWLGSTRVTADNKDDILNDGGKARFDPATATLTLNDPVISGVCTKEVYTGKILSRDMDLTVKGSYTMTEADAEMGIYDLRGDLTLDGDFTFLGSNSGVYSSRDVTVSGGSLYAQGTFYGLNYPDNLTVESGVSRIELEGDIQALRTDGLDVADSLRLTAPAGGQIVASDVYESDMTTLAQHIIWENSTPGYSLQCEITSFLSDSDPITLELTMNSTGEAKTATVYGNNATYRFNGLTAGRYTICISKKNHVDRDYSITVSGNTTQDVKICPLGDVNMNGKVQANDAMMAYQHAQGKADAQLTDYAFKCADVAPAGNVNGKVQAADAMVIYQQAQGKHSLF